MPSTFAYGGGMQTTKPCLLQDSCCKYFEIQILSDWETRTAILQPGSKDHTSEGYGSENIGHRKSTLVKVMALKTLGIESPQHSEMNKNRAANSAYLGPD
ncbi:hypothetical protein STEG23_012187 [Scotinomys teguina]